MDDSIDWRCESKLINVGLWNSFNLIRRATETTKLITILNNFITSQIWPTFINASFTMSFAIVCLNIVRPQVSKCWSGTSYVYHTSGISEQNHTSSNRFKLHNLLIDYVKMKLPTEFHRICVIFATFMHQPNEPKKSVRVRQRFWSSRNVCWFANENMEETCWPREDQLATDCWRSHQVHRIHLIPVTTNGNLIV